MPATGSSEHFDVLIVGAGLSGIAAAYHLQTRLPHKSVAILESRDRLGGTWDLFRYPGVRSDSDMQTLGYGFRPWRGDKALADGASIAAYIADTARAFGIDSRIRCGHRVTRAAWSSAEALWTVEVERGGEALRFTCGFLFMCSGYYDYASGHRPDWPGVEGFAGRIVHPQFWPADLDYAGRRVVVIGSGATAVTLVPALAEKAAHVTMLQRSPTYVVTRPNRDPFAHLVRCGAVRDLDPSPQFDSRAYRAANMGAPSAAPQSLAMHEMLVPLVHHLDALARAAASATGRPRRL